MIKKVRLYQLKTERGLIPITYEADSIEDLPNSGWSYAFTVNREDIYSNSVDMFHHRFLRVKGNK